MWIVGVVTVAGWLRETCKVRLCLPSHWARLGQQIPSCESFKSMTHWSCLVVSIWLPLVPWFRPSRGGTVTTLVNWCEPAEIELLIEVFVSSRRERCGGSRTLDRGVCQFEEWQMRWKYWWQWMARSVNGGGIWKLIGDVLHKQVRRVMQLVRGNEASEKGGEYFATLGSEVRKCN